LSLPVVGVLSKDDDLEVVPRGGFKGKKDLTKRRIYGVTRIDVSHNAFFDVEVVRFFKFSCKNLSPS